MFGVNGVYTFVVVASCASPVSSNMRACEFVLVLRCCSVNFTFTPSAQLSQLFDRFCSRCLVVFVEHLAFYMIRNPMECGFTLCIVFTPSTKLHAPFFACCEGFKFSSSVLRGGSRLPEGISYFQNSGFHVDGTRQPPSPQTPPPPTMAPVDANLPRHPSLRRINYVFVGARARTLLNRHPNQNLGIERVCFVFGRKDIQDALVQQ